MTERKLGVDYEQVDIIIFGTMHLEPEEYPAYMKRLGEIIV